MPAEPTDQHALRVVSGYTAATTSWRLGVGERTIVGRAGDIAIPDPTLSRRHIALEVFPDGEIWLEDLLSSSGTFVWPVSGAHVNRRRIAHRERVNAGDRISVGRIELVIERTGPLDTLTRRCPACRAILDFRRELGHVTVVSCEQCRSVSRYAGTSEADPTWGRSIEMDGAYALRLEERVVRARDDGTLAETLAALSASEPPFAFLLPELRPVVDAFFRAGKDPHVRLTADARLEWIAGRRRWRLAAAGSDGTGILYARGTTFPLMGVDTVLHVRIPGEDIARAAAAARVARETIPIGIAECVFALAEPAS